MRRLGFGSAIAVGGALLAGSLYGMTGIDSTLQAAVEQPPVRHVAVYEHRVDCHEEDDPRKLEL